MTWISRLLAAFIFVCMLPSVFAADLATERADFKPAWAAAQKGDLAALTPYLNELVDYPLYPYLRYAYLSATLAQQPDGAVESFLNEQAQLPVAEALRQDWLLALASRQDWKTFLANYQNETTPALRCAAVSAHLAGGDRQDRDAWVVAAQHLWLVPDTQPPTCEAAFQYLQAHHRITNDMVVQRIQQALQLRHYALARQLLPQLNATDRPWARIWLDVAEDPAHVLATIQVPDEPKYQPLLINGVQLLARTDPVLARHLWTELSQRYHFASDDVQDMQVRLALEYAWNHQPDAAQMLARVQRMHDPRVIEWRLRTALRNENWKLLLGILPDLGPGAAKPEWRYWKARALEATGHADSAAAIYQALADGMDYYAFLAADHLHLSYDITQEPSQPQPEVITQLEQRPGLVRARELFYADLYDYANAEWQAATDALSKPANCQAALLAQDWGWYGRAIRSFANAGCWQDLTINFPLAYHEMLAARAQALELNLPWVYGVIRAESVFRPNAISQAGAIGLMQLMPETGHRLAANLGLVLDGSDALLNPQTNLTLGSAYLSHLLKRFDGSEPLATAAYNAGVKHVDSWLPESGSLPGDVWVDSIPYWETRGYVRRVMSEAVIFDWRLHPETERLSARLGNITSAPAVTTTAAPTAVSTQTQALAPP
ncbi:MAG: transglycosylase SLT domain-containing protein [Gammaproteobacteria bacterium]